MSDEDIFGHLPDAKPANDDIFSHLPDAPSAALSSEPPANVQAANEAFLANNQGFGLGEKLPSRAELPNRAARVGLGMAEPFVGAAQFASHATGYGTQSTDAAANWIAQKEAEKKAEAGLTPEDWDYWAGAGNIASPMNFIPGGAIGRVAGVGKSIIGTGLRGAAAGAAYGAMEPVTNVTPDNDYWSQKQGQVGTGAITGGVTGAGAGALSKVFSPAASKTAQQLEKEGWDDATIQRAKDLALAKKEGIRTTVGQTTGTERGESIVGDVPFAGSVYRDRLQDFREDANRAALNRALRPFGGQELKPGDPVGTRGIDNLYRQFNDAYDQVHSRMMFTSFSPTFQNTMATDFQRAINGSRLTNAQKEELRDLIQEQFWDKLDANNFVLPGKEIQGISSILRQEAHGYGKSPDWDKRKLGYAIDKIQKAFSAELQRQNGQQLADRLKSIDNGYAYFARARRAAVAAKANDGVFTGNQLMNASSQLNRSVEKGEIARGADPYYQDLAGAMIRLTPRIANSGSPERIARLALGHTITGAAGATVPVQTLATIGGLSAAYTDPVQRALNAAVSARPPGSAALGRTLRTYGPTAGTRALMTGKVGQDQEPEMLPPVRVPVEHARGGKVTHAQQLDAIENGPHSPEQKRAMRRKVFEEVLKQPD